MKKIKPLKLKKDIADIRFLVENYYDIQDNRLRAEGRSRSWRQIYSIAKSEEKVYNENISEKFRDIEKWIYKELQTKVKQHDLWKWWLKNVKGVGPALAGGYFAWIGDISRFKTISALNAYCGLHCDDEGKAVRRAKGQQSNWNSRLKSHAWKTAKSFVKTKGKYRAYYDKVKKAYKKKYPKEVKEGNRTLYTKGHIDNMAMRKTVKLFLSHLWLKWRELEKLDTQSPYPLAKLGHKTFIAPFEDKE